MTVYHSHCSPASHNPHPAPLDRGNRKKRRKQMEGKKQRRREHFLANAAHSVPRGKGKRGRVEGPDGWMDEEED